MTKRVLLFALSLFSVCIISCGYDSDCPPESPTLEPFYINNSGVSVKLIVKDVFSNVESPNAEQEINSNDTLCCGHLESKSCAKPYWEVTHGYEGAEFIYNDYVEYKPAYFRIEFLTEPKVCLVFDGEDKLENDIRYWENYTMIGESSRTYYYAYTITPELMATATEENCYID